MKTWHLLGILLACLLLAGCLIPQDKHVDTVNPPTSAGNKTVATFNKSDQLTFTKTKVAVYTYEIKDKGGKAVSIDKVKNNIDVAKNLLLDCGATVCDYKVEITAKQALQFDADTLKGEWQGEGVSVSKTFYSDVHSVAKTRPTYADVLQEQCYQTVVNDTEKNGSIIFENATKNITLCFNTTVQVQNGTETYYENESFENANLTATFAKDEVRTYVIRFVKDSPSRNVDIYHSIFGQERKDAAWWNASWAYQIPIDINTTVQSNLTNFPARISMNTSNTIYWNTTTCTNVRFIASDNTTVLNYDLDSSSSVFCGNATNNATFWVSVNTTNSSAGLTRIYAYLGNTGAASGENEKAVWSSANYVSVWHGNDANDIMGINNLTATGTVTYPANSTCKVGNCFYYNVNSFLQRNSSTGLATGTSPNTFSAWGWKSAKPPTSEVAYALFGYGTEASYQARYFYYRGIAATLRTESYGGTNANDISASNITGLHYYSSRRNGTAISSGYDNLTTTWTANSYNTGTSGNLRIGSTRPGSDGGGEGWAADAAGAVDEVRFRNVSSTDDWLLAEYGQTASVGAWWNASYANRLPINCSLMDAGTPIAINGSGGFYINGVKQIVWTLCQPDLYLYYNNQMDYVVVNNTAKVAFEVDIGTGSSYNSVSMWRGLGAVGVYHINLYNITQFDSAGFNNLTGNGTCVVVDGSGMGFAGYAIYSPSATVASGGCTYYKSSPTGLPSGTAVSFETFFAKNINSPSGSSCGYSYGTTSAGQLRSLGVNRSDSGNKLYIGGYGSSFDCTTDLTAAPSNTTAYYALQTNSSTVAYAWINKTKSSACSHSAWSTVNANLNLNGYGGAAGNEMVYGYIDELRIYNITKPDRFVNDTFNNWVGTAGYGTLGAVESQGGSSTLIVAFGSGISGISFRPVHAFAKNVEPVNQTASVPLFNITISGSGAFAVYGNQTPTISGFTAKCAPNYNKTGLVTLNTTSQWIMNLTYPNNGSIWCWADFSNPSPRIQSFNISVGGTAYG